MTGASSAAYDVLVGMDADLSHDATALPRLLGALSAGADVVVGSRYVPGGSTVNWPLGRRALSRWGNWYAAHALGSGVADLTSAFRAYRAAALRTVDFGALRAEGYGFLIELAYQLERSGAKFAEVPVQFINRAEGRSKMSPKIAVGVPQGGYPAGLVRSPAPAPAALKIDKAGPHPAHLGPGQAETSRLPAHCSRSRRRTAGAERRPPPGAQPGPVHHARLSGSPASRRRRSRARANPRSRARNGRPAGRRS